MDSAGGMYPPEAYHGVSAAGQLTTALSPRLSLFPVISPTWEHNRGEEAGAEQPEPPPPPQEQQAPQAQQQEEPQEQEQLWRLAALDASRSVASLEADLLTLKQRKDAAASTHQSALEWARGEAEEQRAQADRWQARSAALEREVEDLRAAMVKAGGMPLRDSLSCGPLLVDHPVSQKQEQPLTPPHQHYHHPRTTETPAQDLDGSWHDTAKNGMAAVEQLRVSALHTSGELEQLRVSALHTNDELAAKTELIVRLQSDITALQLSVDSQAMALQAMSAKDSGLETKLLSCETNLRTTIEGQFGQLLLVKKHQAAVEAAETRAIAADAFADEHAAKLGKAVSRHRVETAALQALSDSLNATIANQVESVSQLKRDHDENISGMEDMLAAATDVSLKHEQTIAGLRATLAEKSAEYQAEILIRDVDLDQRARKDETLHTHLQSTTLLWENRCNELGVELTDREEELKAVKALMQSTVLGLQQESEEAARRASTKESEANENFGDVEALRAREAKQLQAQLDAAHAQLAGHARLVEMHSTLNAKHQALLFMHRQSDAHLAGVNEKLRASLARCDDETARALALQEQLAVSQNEHDLQLRDSAVKLQTVQSELDASQEQASLAIAAHAALSAKWNVQLDKHNTVQARAADDLRKSLRQVEELKAALETPQREIDELNSRINEMQRDARSALARESGLQSRNQELQSEMDSLQSELMSSQGRSETEASATARRIAGLEQALEQAKADRDMQIAALEERLSSSESRERSSAKEAVALREALDRIKTLRQQNTTLEDSLEQLKQKLNALEKSSKLEEMSQPSAEEPEPITRGPIKALKGQLAAFGTGLDVPRHLRWGRPIRNRKLTRKEVAAIVQELKENRALNTDATCSSFSDFLYLYYHRKYGVAGLVMEWTYNLQFCLEKYLDDPTFHLFHNVLNETVSEDIFPAQITLVDRLRAALESTDKVVNSCADPKGSLPLKTVVDTVTNAMAHVPLAEKYDVIALCSAAEKDHNSSGAKRTLLLETKAMGAAKSMNMFASVATAASAAKAKSSPRPQLMKYNLLIDPECSSSHFQQEMARQMLKVYGCGKAAARKQRESEGAGWHNTVEGKAVSLLPPNIQRRLVEKLTATHLFKLTDTEMSNLVQHMFTTSYQAGAVVITQGEQGDQFFVMDTGKVDVYVAAEEMADTAFGNRVNTLGPDDNFGDVALIHNVKRTSTVVCQTAVSCFVLDRTTFQHALVEKAREEKLRLEALMETVQLFKDCISMTDKVILAEHAQHLDFEDGDVVCHAGDMSHSWYIVDGGEVFVPASAEPSLGPGCVIAQDCLLEDLPLQHDYVAKGATRCLMISPAELRPFRESVINHWAKVSPS